ncbi:hypothetical protein NQ038_12685 [Brevibacterium sp. 50QC2O2]|uniref:hypothetical protein n=1 Tax=Brevibacterium TaxID=1696 RepID=UPI00211C5652|nr:MULTISPECIES: hypothetical protein [unclassified Brevibacterium]MCQ9368662.1 hypothetical protein [Brevibacterium sp. 91QC2O2]MCQ9386408.1 hypothetical protein [Brevibacterium sp. 68QC2CO]MCQ9389495.1 hypothetical protein [Brevibacterium sp. 50QC2O2]
MNTANGSNANGSNATSSNNVIASLHWPLIIGLGALALLRPVLRIVAEQLGVSVTPVVPILATLVISAVWIAVVGLSRVAHPLLTLVFTGLAYAVFAIVLSGVLSPILDGRLQGPLANPLAIVPMLATNAIWGLLAGALALLVRRAR